MTAQRLVEIGCLALVAAGSWAQELTIGVKLENTNMVPMPLLAQAQATATRIYAGIGVKLTWSNRRNAQIRIQFDDSATPSLHPGALGYALPYCKGGTRIHLLVDRVSNHLLVLSKTTPSWYAGTVLGHVMAHELGHVLEASVRHADSGVMKARWDDRDFSEMQSHPLAFDVAEVELIRIGVLREAGRPTGRTPEIAQVH
jgi:hypothetical protein